MYFEPWTSELGPVTTSDHGSWVQVGRFVRYSVGFVYVFLCHACISLCFRMFLGARGASREVLGDARSIIQGQLGHLRRILDKSRARMITCDVIWLCVFENIMILHWFHRCFGECVSQGFGVVEGWYLKILIFH